MKNTNNVIYINGEVTDSLVEHFISCYNKADKNEHITIYINSVGGEIAHSALIIDIINKNADNISLVACGEIFSAAFEIFFFSKCNNKQLLEDCIGMAHYSWSTFALDEAGKVSSEYEKFLLQEMKKNKIYTLKKFQEIGLTQKELGVIKRGKDCFFNRERLEELLKYKRNG